jgi:aldehyde:ferredoxin oxidoreductase
MWIRGHYGIKEFESHSVKGNGSIGVQKPEEFMEMVRKVSLRLRPLEGAKGRREYGTLVASPLYNELSALSYKNYQDDCIPEESFRKISHQVFHRMYEMDP